MVIVVKPGQSIQAAVNAAAPGDTILVKQGVYNESVVVRTGKERIRLLGEGAGKSILNGSGSGHTHGFVVEDSDFVTIAGFTVHSFQRAGVFLQTSDNIVRDNEVQGNMESGIIIDESAARNLVKGNKIIFNGDAGIAVSAPYTYLVANSVTENGGSGIDVGPGSTYTLVLENEVLRNADTGVRVRANFSWIIGNQATNNATGGLDVRGAEHVLVYGNTSTDNANCGLEADALGLIVVKNNLSGNGKGGFAAVSGGGQLGLQLSLLYGNELSHNVQAGFAGDASIVGNLLFKNDVFENGTNGVHLGGSKNRVLFNNVTSNSGSGVNLMPTAEANVIDANQVGENQSVGIALHEKTVGNAVRSNHLERNRPFDVRAESPADTRNTFDVNELVQEAPVEVGE